MYVLCLYSFYNVGLARADLQLAVQDSKILPKTNTNAIRPNALVDRVPAAFVVPFLPGVLFFVVAVDEGLLPGTGVGVVGAGPLQ